MKSLLILLSLFLTVSINADIGDIPRRDIHEIKFLFERLIVAHNFAYTIFGSKPMSLASMCLEIPPDLPIYRRLKARFTLINAKRHLNSWYKYKDRVTFRDFIFLDKEEDLFESLVIILINKKNLLNVLYSHESVFKEELGDSFTPESFLKSIERREISLAKAIHNNDRLLGIMLGYGERNATLFQERLDIMKELEKREKNETPPFDELIEKLQAVENRLTDFNEFEEDPIIPPLYFLADASHKETIELRKRYKEDQKKIAELLGQSNFMDKVMKQLMY